MTDTEFTGSSLPVMASYLRAAGLVYVCGHVSPDGDCIGSTLALVHALRHCGIRAQGLLADPLPRNLAFLPGADELRLAEEMAEPCDLFVAVDVSTAERLGGAAAAFAAAKKTMRIDHHETSGQFAWKEYVDPEAVSTTLLIWKLAACLRAQTPEVSVCCYTGLCTDSGRFSYQNTNAEAFEAAAQMVHCGVNPSLVTAALTEHDSYAALALEARAVQRLVVDRDLGWALTFLTKEDFEELEADKADAEGVVNQLRRLEGVHMLCCAREQDGAVRLSFRGKGDYNVREIALKFGGGGHAAAAGATVEAPLHEVLPRVSRLMAEACRRHG